MASVTLAEQPGTPVIQFPNDCKQCRFAAPSYEGGPYQHQHPQQHYHQQVCCNPKQYSLPLQVPVGAKSTKGRRPNMEDCEMVVENFVQLNMYRCTGEIILPEALQAQPVANSCVSCSMDSIMSGSSETMSTTSSASSLGRCDNIDGGVMSHFMYAAVFDGHGGSAVSLALSQRLHFIVKSELEGLNNGIPVLTINHIASGLKNSFVKMDSELGDEAKTAGSTGVVTMISHNHIVVGNCGDSRAVLFRGQQPFRLSRDHKPTQPDEQERIVRAGGRVCNYNGMRVMGLLAMTRAFGDHCLSNFGIIAEPEVTIIERQTNDDFIILASDGLWDVVSDSEACALAHRCFIRAQERKASSDTAAKVAASVLMRVAVDKGSSDNITVVVIDLRD